MCQFWTSAVEEPDGGLVGATYVSGLFQRDPSEPKA